MNKSKERECKPSFKALQLLFPGATKKTWHQHPNGGGWVENTAVVASTAFIDSNAQVFGNAKVYGNAQVFGNAKVYGNAQVFGNAKVFGHATVFGNAKVYGNAWVYRDAWEISPIQIQGSKHFLNEATEGQVKICCRVLPLADEGNVFDLSFADMVRYGLQQEATTPKVFDWDLAVRILLAEGATEACAGLAEDWEATSGWILRGGKPIARSESYTYLASQWATPVLKIGDTVYDCFQLQSLAPELDAYTFWPEEAKAAWLAGRSRPRPRPRFKGIRAANFSLEVEELEDEG